MTNNHDYHFGHNTSDLIKCEYMWYECVTDGSPLPVKYVVQRVVSIIVDKTINKTKQLKEKSQIYIFIVNEYKGM